MQTYECACGAMLFFDNRRCVACGRDAGWCDACRCMTAVADDGRCSRGECGAQLTPCANRTNWDACSAFVPGEVAEPQSLCRSCQLTILAPDLAVAENVRRWSLLETAKRRLLYDFQALGYPDERLAAAPPLAFRFMADTPEEHVITGHADGVITINLAEADPVYRETARQEFGEPQRTLIGHMRHESGHVFWMREINEIGGSRADASRKLFGNHEAPPYADAMQAYYQQGPPADWQQRFISRYGASHPWEDFAETFAFYLDMRSVIDTLACHVPAFAWADGGDLQTMLQVFQKAGIVLNEVNRSVGLTDLVPEVVAPAVVAKIQFMHDLFTEAATVTNHRRKPP